MNQSQSKHYQLIYRTVFLNGCQNSHPAEKPEKTGIITTHSNYLREPYTNFRRRIRFKALFSPSGSLLYLVWYKYPPNLALAR